jgi:hypothetical protein
VNGDILICLDAYRIHIDEEELSTGMVPGIIQDREKLYSF